MAKPGKRSFIPRAAADGSEGGNRKYLSNVEQELLGLREDHPDRETAYVALKYYQSSHECFSEWSREELKAFSAFCRKVAERTWEQIKQSGGAGNKAGLGYTSHRDRKKLPNNGLRHLISPEVEFAEMRVSQRARVHGFRMKATFFLVWLDKDHQIYAE
ncbi:MAG TPA: hypothetical protein VEX86_09460 [Longimicrobium sp.]|nr:hypothetical protein [Longimicrobium sp.]